MLVLTRKLQESIRVGDSVTVTILRVKGNTVRVGIEAPDQVRIVRSELPDFSGSPAAAADADPDRTAPRGAAKGSNGFPGQPPLADRIAGDRLRHGHKSEVSTSDPATVPARPR